MKIAFFDTKPYDKIWFEPLSREYKIPIKFYEYKLSAETAYLAKGYKIVCAFVNDDLGKDTVDTLCDVGVEAIVLRCAGYNNVDLKAADGRLTILRVPDYSPYAVAEHAAALLLTLNRKTHRAYLRTRDNNFNINGLMGIDLHGKNAGLIGMGKIGAIFAKILQGFGMNVYAYDVSPRPINGVEYVDLDTLYNKADVLSLHCPLTKETHHILNRDAFSKMRNDVIIINTSRGALINTDALIDALKDKKVKAAGLDVYEEEHEYFFEDLSNEIMEDDDLARLLTFPNVLITSHQAFFTAQAMQNIAMVTMENVYAFLNNKEMENEVKCC